jgi:acetyl esterase/lipase
VRSSFRYFAPYLAGRGYAAFAISYRLAKKGHPTFPEAVQDVLAAVQFVRGSAGEFGLDPDRIGLMGNSAGAHLAALAALAGDEPMFAGGYPQDAHAAVDTRVKVLVGVYGVYDMVESWQHFRMKAAPDNNLETFLGAAPTQDRRLYFDASPLSYVTTAKNQLAVFLSAGTEDDIVNRQAQTDAFLLALKQCGFFVRTCIVQGAGHYWMNDPIDERGSHAAFVVPRLVRFLEERL